MTTNNVTINVLKTGLKNKRSHEEYSACKTNIMGLGGIIINELTTFKDDNFNAIVSFNRNDAPTAIKLLKSIGFICKYATK